MKSLKFSIFFIFIFALSLSTIFQTKAFASEKTPNPANSSQSVRLDGCPDLRGKGVCLGAGYANITEQDYIDLNLGFEFDFDVVGIGVNVPLRIKTKGGLAVKENEWDDPNDYFRVVRYLRIGNKGDTFYGLIGELRNVLIGHGTIMSGYTNLGDPAFWNVGLAADLNFDQISIETVFDNIIKPNLLGGRLRVGMGILNADEALSDFGIGFTVLADTKAPDEFKLKEERSTEAEIQKDLETLSKTETGNSKSPYTRDVKTDDVKIFGVDLDYRLLKSKIFSLTPYIDMNFVSGGGNGTHIGILHQSGFTGFNLFSKWEYRYLKDNYMPSYFNSNYEFDKFSYLGSGSSRITKRQYLMGSELADSNRSGYYASVGGDFIGFIQISGSYENMIGVSDDASGNLRASLPNLGPFMAYADYSKTGINSLTELWEFDDRSLFNASLIYFFTPMYVNFSFVRTWEEGLPSDQYVTNVGLAYKF